MTRNISSFFRRNSVSIAIGVIIVAFAIILYLQSIAVSQLQGQVAGQQEIIRQVKGVSDQLNTRGIERTKQLKEINQHLDCIVHFFNQPDRSQKAIDDIDTCTVKPA